MVRRHPLHALVLAAAMLASVMLVPPAVAGTATAHLASSVAMAPFAGTVTLSGTVTGDAACGTDRVVRLRWRPAGTSTFSLLGESVTANDGSFSFEAARETSGRYRATLPGTGSCTAIATNDVVVHVRALVDASVVVGTPRVGDCVDITSIVSPPKPGQTVELQRRGGGGWQTVETLALNGNSIARARPCVGWDDLGVARYRVRWPSQDALNETSASPELAFEVLEAGWMQRVDDVIGRRPISVAVGEDSTFLYRHLDQADRTPASNEKLLLAMVLLDTFGPDHRIPTLVAAESLDGAVVRGDLWLLGRGDPIVTASSLAALAEQVDAAGIERVTGRVMGATTFFARDWSARGWNDVATDYVNRPTALTFEGNRDPEPERAAAAAFTKLLEKRGISVRGRPAEGEPPNGLDVVATGESKPLTVLLAKTLRPSWNFAAEVLGKGLGAEAAGTPGTIAKGAAAIESWVRAHGADDFSLYDNSGLSYANRVDAAGIVELLWAAEASTWGDALRHALPAGGQGTLEDRLHHVKLRAKTGTLTDVSALSGWVWADRLDAWVEFSIVSDIGKPAATDLEDKIVRLLANNVG